MLKLSKVRDEVNWPHPQKKWSKGIPLKSFLFNQLHQHYMLLFLKLSELKWVFRSRTGVHLLISPNSAQWKTTYSLARQVEEEYQEKNRKKWKSMTNLIGTRGTKGNNFCIRINEIDSAGLENIDYQIWKCSRKRLISRK